MRNSTHKFGFLTLLGLYLVFCSSTAFGQATIQRDIQEFVDAQIGWYAWFDPETGNYFTLDYVGHLNRDNALHLDTTFTGTVTERPLADGRARVRVELRTENALTYVTYDKLGLVFGHFANEVK